MDLHKMVSDLFKENDRSKIEGRDLFFYLYKQVNTINCPELAQVYTFLEDHNFSSELLDENTKSLKVLIDSGIGSHGSSMKGQITIKDIEDRTILLHEFFHQASQDFVFNDSGIVIVGEDKKNGIALNEGITDYLSYVVDEKYEPKYQLEFMVAKRLIEGYGLDILNGYFNADRLEFEEAFGSKNSSNINNIIDALDACENAELNDKYEEYTAYLMIICNNLIKLGLKPINPTKFADELAERPKFMGKQ